MLLQYHQAAFDLFTQQPTWPKAYWKLVKQSSVVTNGQALFGTTKPALWPLSCRLQPGVQSVLRLLGRLLLPNHAC